MRGAISLGIEDLITVQGSVIYRLERSSGLKEIVQVYVGARLHDSRIRAPFKIS